MVEHGSSAPELGAGSSPSRSAAHSLRRRAKRLNLRADGPQAMTTSDDAATLDPLTGGFDDLTRLAPTSVLGLAITWSKHEPERVGEVFFVDGPSVIGRGEAPVSGARRPRPIRQRPDSDRPSRPLASPRLSREQLWLEPKIGYLIMKSVGKARVTIDGVESREGRLEPGQTVSVGRELGMLAIRRPRYLPPPRSWPAESDFEFGMPDPFGLVGESPAAWELREQLAFAARSDAHVLLIGESGTGKELAAGTIHGLSSRRAEPFVSRNASTIPETLVDSELFGNAKNYPNPGMAERAGLIGEADGGSLFLDEIGEMSVALQAHLLRVLDNGGEYQRLGESRARHASLRVIAATNRGRHELKPDLLARFALVIELPPLDARREDIPFLASHLVRRAAAKAAVDPPSIGLDLMDALVRHPFRLHSRELEQILWQGLAQTLGPELNLTPAIQAQLLASSEQSDECVELRSEGSAPRELSAGEVERALLAANGSVTVAARALGLRNRFVLYRLLRKLGIELPRG